MIFVSLNIFMLVSLQFILTVVYLANICHTLSPYVFIFLACSSQVLTEDLKSYWICKLNKFWQIYASVVPCISLVVAFVVCINLAYSLHETVNLLIKYVWWFTCLQQLSSADESWCSLYGQLFARTCNGPHFMIHDCGQCRWWFLCK